MELMENIKLRQGTLEDIDGIMKVEQDAFHAGIVEDREVFLERLKFFSEGFLALEKEDKDEKEIIGYVCGEIWTYSENPKKYTFSLGHSINEVLNREGTELYIASMGLLETKRSNGLGRKMFGRYIGYMKESWPKLSSVILIVCESWKGARKIYKEAGFLEIGEKKDFFDYGEAAPKEKGIIMRMKL